jgi:hypothetical protein
MIEIPGEFPAKRAAAAPRRYSARPFNLIVIDELVIRALHPAAQGLIILAWKDAHRGGNGDVGGVVKVDVRFV